jgi:hypothetical protein
VALTNLTSIDADEHPLRINNSIEFKCLAEIEADKAIHRVVIELFFTIFLFVHLMKFFVCLFLNINFIECIECSWLVLDENKQTRNIGEIT